MRPRIENAKDHSQAQIELLKQSIEAHGFVAPIIATLEGDIVAGHGRYEAARQLGLASVNVIFVKMSAKDAREYGLKDNSLADLGEWNEDALRLELMAVQDAGGDLDSFGFDEDRLAKMLDLEASKAAEELGEALEESIKIPALAVTVTFDKQGDIDHFRDLTGLEFNLGEKVKFPPI